MKKYSRIIALLLAVVLVLPGAGLVTQANTTLETPHVERLSGDTRVETAVAVSKAAYPTTATTVILAGYNGGVDALTGTLLAAKLGAPVLFTEAGKLNAETKLEIERLGATTVHVLGGEKAVSKVVFEAVNALTGVTAERIDGENRYETAANVATKLASTTKHAFVALGVEDAMKMLPDALAVGPAAAKLNSPILLTLAGKLPAETKAALAGMEKVTLVGGEKAILPAVKAELEGMGITVDRVAGLNREGTSLEIAKAHFAGSDKAVLANGYKGADALIGGYFAAKHGAPILLVQETKVHPDVQTYVTANVNMAYVLGGTTVVADTVLNSVNTLIDESVLKIVSLNAVGAKKLEVVFNKVVTEGTFQVKKGAIAINVKEVKYSEDKKTAVIELATKLTKGDYTVTHGENSTVITVENEKVSNIELSDLAVLSSDAKVITTSFKILNQYKEDITSISSLNFTSGKGVATPNYVNGVLEIDNNSPTGTDVAYTVDEKVTISALHAGTTTFASSVLKVAQQAKVSTIEIMSLYHEDDKLITVDSTDDLTAFKLVIDAKDQYGKAIPYGSIQSDVLVTVTNSSEINVKGGFATPTFESIQIDGKATTILELATPKTGPAKLTAGTYTITIISKTTGDLARFDIVVKEGIKVDILNASAPEIAVAGESFEIPFTAVDQFGKAITKSSDLDNGMTSYSISAGSVAFEQDYVKNTAKLVVDATALTAKQTLIFTGITKTNQVVQLSINLVDPAQPTVITGLKNATTNIAVGGDSELKAENVVVKDQYGRDYKVVTSAVNPSLGSGANDYKVLATTSVASKVSLTGAEINSTSATIKLNGVDKGTSTITLALTKGNSAVPFENSEFTFTAKVVKKADIASYEIEDFGKLYHISGTTHDVNLKVNGLLENGEKVAIPGSYYTAVINDAQVTINNGVIDSVSGYVWGNQVEREVAVIVTVHAANGPLVLTKNLTVSNVEPKATTLSLKTNGVATLEDKGLVSIDIANLSNLASVKTLVINAIKVLDQYGVEISETAWETVNTPSKFYSIIVTDLGTKTIDEVNGASTSTIAAGDTFNVTAVTYNGQVMTFKVIVK